MEFHFLCEDKIKVDKDHPQHELVMMANNLGSIPPNTFSMIITANDVRHVIFVSINEEMNAKITVDFVGVTIYIQPPQY